MQPPLAPVRILVADSDEASARQLELALIAEPCVDVVGWAGTRDQALELLSRRGADIVLLAVDFPGVPETLAALVQVPPKAPKVLLMADGNDGVSGRNGTDLASLAARPGNVAGFVRKTEEASEMVTLVIALVALASIPSGELNGSKS